MMALFAAELVFAPLCYRSAKLVVSRVQNFIELMLYPVDNFNASLCVQSITLSLPNVRFNCVVPIRHTWYYYFAEFNNSLLKNTSIYETWYGNYSILDEHGEKVDNQYIDSFDITLFDYKYCFSEPDLIYTKTGFYAIMTTNDCAFSQNENFTGELIFHIDGVFYYQFNMSYYSIIEENRTIIFFFAIQQDQVKAINFLVNATGETFIRLYDTEDTTMKSEFQVFKRHNFGSKGDNLIEIVNASVQNSYLFVNFAQHVWHEPEECIDCHSSYIMHFYQVEWPSYITEESSAEFIDNNMTLALGSNHLNHVSVVYNQLIFYKDKFILLAVDKAIPYDGDTLNIMTLEHIMHRDSTIISWEYTSSVYTHSPDNNVSLVVKNNEICIQMENVTSYVKTLAIYNKNELKISVLFPRPNDNCVQDRYKGLIDLLYDNQSVILLELKQSSGVFYTQILNFEALMYSQYITLIICCLAVCVVLAYVVILLAFRDLSFYIPLLRKTQKAEKED